jgi:quinol monooxygenase YgiN
MIIVAGELRMQTGTRALFFEAVAPMVAETLQESGCQTYAFSPDVHDDDLIRLFEVYDDQSLAAHLSSAHMDAWKLRRAALPIAGAALMRYTVSSAEPLG